MRVLVTNDDGIHSPGLTVLAQIAHDAGHEVLVVAPHHEYSGASASLIGHQRDGKLLISAGRPPGLPEEVHAHAVHAAPGLIAFAAAYEAFGDRPDLVLSGVNLGANTGHATLHSGTVGAALSATTLGIGAMAASIAAAEPQHWETARLVCEEAFAWLLEHPRERGVLNVNVPDVPPDQLRGLRAAGLAEFGAVQARVKERGQEYVTLTYSAVEDEHVPGTDAYLVARGWASVSVLHAPVHDAGRLELPEFTTAAGEAGEEAPLTEVDVGRVMSSGPQE